MITMLTDAGALEVNTSDPPWLTVDDAARVTGWVAKPEGMCCDDACIALPASAVRGRTVDVAAFWRKLDAPIVHSDAEDVWVLGASAQTRQRALLGANAPDFTLPDLEGRLHTLSSLRGRKVFLATWASW
jgi:hypothetical protein